jgi:hypothetical protein
MGKRRNAHRPGIQRFSDGIFACEQRQEDALHGDHSIEYVDVSLDGDIRYNPLNSDADAYAQAFNIASVIVAIWGKGKEPFWQQSYTDLVRYVIMLHRTRDGYLPMPSPPSALV